MNKLTGLKSKFGIPETETAEKVYEKAGLEFLNCVPENKLNEYAEEMLKYFTMEQFISTLFYATQKEEIVDYAKLAEKASKLNVFQSKPREIKTVATFYFRMFNGGAEKVISLLTDIWVKQGYNVVLFTDKEASSDDYHINSKVTRIILPEAMWQDFKSVEKRCSVLIENLKKYSVDTLVYHAWNHYGMICDAMACKSLGISFVVHTHGSFCTDTLSEITWCAYESTLMHKVYLIADLIIALNKSDCAYWKSFGLNCTHTINPVPEEIKNAKTSKLNGKNVIMVCRISPEKQVLDGIKIIQEVNKKIPEATLTIVGSGDNEDYVSSIKSYIKDNNLENVVNMTGFTKDVTPYYQSADVMLMTSKYEGAPLVVTESKACRLPLVSYDIPNLDTLRNSSGTIVVSQNDIQTAAEKIVEILTDDTLKKELGAQARKSAEEIFGIDFQKLWTYVFSRIFPDVKGLNAQSEDIEGALKNLVYYTSYGMEIRLKKQMDEEIFNRNEIYTLKLKNSEIAEEINLLAETNLTLENEISILNQKQSELEDVISELKNEEQILRELLENRNARNEELENTVKELRNSTSYRLGWFLTTIPRKIKDFIKGQKYVE